MNKPPPAAAAAVRRSLRISLTFLVLIACAGAAGCRRLTHTNRRLNAANVLLEDRDRNGNHTRAVLAPLVQVAAEDTDDDGPNSLPADGDGYFVGVAISGGGSRSANFAAACMFQLQRLGLLQRVDYISAVSGGSLAAAYYCLHDDRRWNPGDAQRDLTHPFASDVIANAVLPWNYATLALTDWDRTDLLARGFRQKLFSRGRRALTFADLRDDRPRLLINATDLASGRRFVFCDESFDELNSDLSAYPVANAVAASSAVPVILHHVTLRDYSTTFKAYRHLIDGGVSDPLGVESLVDAYREQVRAAERAGRPDPYPAGVLIIAIDADVKASTRLANRGDVGFIDSLVAGAGLSTTVLLNRISSAILAEVITRNAADDVTARELRQYIDGLKKTGYLEMEDRTGRRVRVVHLALSRVEGLAELPFPGFRETLNNIATYFNIDDDDAYHLYQAADLLVEELFEPRLREIVVEMDGDDREADMKE